MKTHWEPLSGTCRVLVSESHRFSTDTLLLAHFAAPKKGERCADLGCGCGTVPLVWAARYAPEEIFGVELSEEAASLAERSVAENGYENIKIFRGDVREPLPSPKGSLDLVACNPPYQAAGSGIPGEDAERQRARFAETMTLPDAANAAKTLLRFGGRFCMCLRPERLADAVTSLREAGLEPKVLRFVQQRAEKAPSLFLISARRGGRPGLRVLPPRLLEDASGETSREMEEIYGDYRAGRGLKTRWEEENANTQNG